MSAQRLMSAERHSLVGDKQCPVGDIVPSATNTEPQDTYGYLLFSQSAGIFTPGFGHVGHSRPSWPSPGSLSVSWPKPCHFRYFISLHCRLTLISSSYRFYRMI